MKMNLIGSNNSDFDKELLGVKGIFSGVSVFLLGKSRPGQESWIAGF